METKLGKIIPLNGPKCGQNMANLRFFRGFLSFLPETMGQRGVQIITKFRTRHL